MNPKEKSEIEDFLNSIPDEFRLIEEKINAEAIDDYYAIAGNLDDGNKPKIIQFQDNWQELQFPKEVKELLVCLSEIGDVKSYRIIEEIIKTGKPEILDFSHVALKIARLNLENSLSDEPVGFISTELGGKNNKMRCYFVVKSNTKIDADKESNLINVIANICKLNDSEVEEIENHDKYVLIKILISFEVAFGNLIDELTKRISFLEKEYIATNVEKPTAEFIEKWMDDELE